MTHLILGELEKEHKAQKAPGATAEAAKPDADADELREKFRIVRVSPLQSSQNFLHHELQSPLRRLEMGADSNCSDYYLETYI